MFSMPTTSKTQYSFVQKKKGAKLTLMIDSMSSKLNTSMSDKKNTSLPFRTSSFQDVQHGNIYENRSEKWLKIYPKPALVCMPAKCSIYPLQKIVISLEDKDFLLGPMA